MKKIGSGTYRLANPVDITAQEAIVGKMKGRSENILQIIQKMSISVRKRLKKQKAECKRRF